MKEIDLESIIDLESSFDVFDENIPHISNLNNWLIGINGTLFIILFNTISEFKMVFLDKDYHEIIF